MRAKHPQIDSAFYYKLMVYITQKVPVVGVEPATSSVIGTLQKWHYPVLAFTGRGKDHLHSHPVLHYDKQTQNELRQAGIDFSLSEIPGEFKDLPEPYRIKYGIIFAGEAKKGPFLRKLLEQAGYFPKKIIFVSKMEHLISVEESMKELSIDFIGIHYNYISRHSHTFDPLIALIQLKTLFEKDQLLSNEQAMKLKSQLYEYIP